MLQTIKRMIPSIECPFNLFMWGANFIAIQSARSEKGIKSFQGWIEPLALAVNQPVKFFSPAKKVSGLTAKTS